MKKGLLIVCAILYVAMCSVLVLACNNEPSAEESSPDVFTFDKKCMALCDKSKQPGKYEISKDCADCMKDNYKKKDKKKKMEGLKLMARDSILGFNIQVAELQEMLDTLKAHGGGNVYAMLAVRDTMEGKKEKLVPELVFQVEPNANQNKVADGGGSQYFDFTRPCPDYCPKVD